MLNALAATEPNDGLLERYGACKAMARGYAQARANERTRLSLARAFTAVVLEAFWASLVERCGARMRIRPVPLQLPAFSREAKAVAVSAGRLIAEFPVDHAGYLIGSIYTVMLPDAHRTSMGAYYTPPPLVARLISQAQEAGFNIATDSAIDPACGGGAFLAPLASRMVEAWVGQSPELILGRLARRLKGIELDPFAAWMTTVLVEAAVLPICVAAKRRMPNVVEVSDTLQRRDVSNYGLVIGNPPYGRVQLDAQQRKYFSRSLYGHANLYGLFMDWGLRHVRDGGVLGFVTPTSFLGGQYFKSLRRLLCLDGSPVSLDFVADRDGVFDDVLQETILFVHSVGRKDRESTVSRVITRGLSGADVMPIATTRISDDGSPWLLPRSSLDAELLENVRSMPNRLIDVGYAVSTGPLVWNRHREQLRAEKNQSTHPLIWSESVTSSGFIFSAERRNHVPFLEVYPGQGHLITKEPCVLVQRTTSKEQNRRVLAALLPGPFLEEYGGVVVENHLNVVRPLPGASVSPGTIAALLNTAVVDRLFRCISGSVAVSAFELNAVPLPSLSELRQLERLVESGASMALIDRRVAGWYGASWDN